MVKDGNSRQQNGCEPRLRAGVRTPVPRWGGSSLFLRLSENFLVKSSPVIKWPAASKRRRGVEATTTALVCRLKAHFPGV